MGASWRLTILVFVVTLGLLISSSAGTATQRLAASSGSVQTFLAESGTPEAEEVQEEDDDGWFKRGVDTIVDLPSDVVECTGDVAGNVWDVIRQTPGTVANGANAIWNAIAGSPGAIKDGAGAASQAIIVAALVVWDLLEAQHLLDVVLSEIEWGWYADFVEDHPLLGRILGPFVLIIFGLTADGRVSVLNIFLVGALVAVPIGKVVGRAIVDAVPAVLGGSGRVSRTIKAVDSNPAGILRGIRDSTQLLFAKTIRPTSTGLASLPKSPGVYVARGADDSVLYMGMSGSLRSRVPQHFGANSSGFAKHTTSLKIVKTESLSDARSLECRLIKTYRPG